MLEDDRTETVEKAILILSYQRTSSLSILNKACYLTSTPRCFTTRKTMVVFLVKELNSQSRFSARGIVVPRPKNERRCTQNEGDVWVTLGTKYYSFWVTSIIMYNTIGGVQPISRDSRDMRLHLQIRKHLYS